ncbi:MAG: 2-amino-4-hydroxy-6-hydroxymethyldihydropteridine diphosphokinase [Candidatus Gastranaerophilales bacterium]|nr:2-amino-4-hydroxy-6-hydroxymethyldihydropteridine diphosphokinase [Candidatus Gastranaerophilales bacterium]
MVEVYLALGANMGSKKEAIKKAYVLLELNPQIKFVKKSKFYASKPYGNDKLHDFVNTVIKIKTNLLPLELLHYIKKIESMLGRKSRQNNVYENRPIDIDILFYGNIQLKTPELTIPHKDIKNRDFVVFPLIEIAPEFRNILSPVTIKNNLELIND